MSSSLRLIDELIYRQDLVPARLEPFGTTTCDLATPCLQGGLDSSLKSAAFVCPDLNEKNWLVGRARIYLLSDPLDSIYVGGSDLYTILATAIAIGINDACALADFSDI